MVSLAFYLLDTDVVLGKFAVVVAIVRFDVPKFGVFDVDNNDATELGLFVELNESVGVLVTGAPNDNVVTFGAVDDPKLGNCVFALTGVTETAGDPKDKVAAAVGCAPKVGPPEIMNISSQHYTYFESSF